MIAFLIVKSRALSTNKEKVRHAEYGNRLLELVGKSPSLFPKKEIGKLERHLCYSLMFYVHYCFYALDTAKKIVADSLHVMSHFSTSLQEKRCSLYAALCKGHKRLFYVPDKDVIFLTIDRAIIYNKILSKCDTMLARALIAYDQVCIIALLRTGEAVQRDSQYSYPTEEDLEKRLTWGKCFSKASDARSMESCDTLKEWIMDMHKSTPEWLGFELTKSKTDQTGKTCKVYVTSGSDLFAPAKSIISLAAERIQAGEQLDFDSCVFAYHEAVALNTFEVVPLSYEKVLKFDKIRSKKLDLPSGTVKTHCRRKGGASSVAGLSGIGLHKVKIIGRWSLGVQDAYIKLSAAEIVTVQNRAIRLALKNLSNGYKTKIFDWDA